MGFRTLYGGRYLRTTLVLATTGIAAGAVTGAVGLGLASPAKPHEKPTTEQGPTSGKHHRHTRPAPQLTYVFSHRPTASPTPTKPSPSPSLTPTHAVTTAPATSAPPTTAPPSTESTSGDASSAPQSQPTG